MHVRNVNEATLLYTQQKMMKSTMMLLKKLIIMCRVHNALLVFNEKDLRTDPGD